MSMWSALRATGREAEAEEATRRRRGVSGDRRWRQTVRAGACILEWAQSRSCRIPSRSRAWTTRAPRGRVGHVMGSPPTLCPGGVACHRGDRSVLQDAALVSLRQHGFDGLHELPRRLHAQLHGHAGPRTEGLVDEIDVERMLEWQVIGVV